MLTAASRSHSGPAPHAPAWACRCVASGFSRKDVAAAELTQPSNRARIFWLKLEVSPATSSCRRANQGENLLESETRFARPSIWLVDWFRSALKSAADRTI